VEKLILNKVMTDPNFMRTIGTLNVTMGCFCSINTTEEVSRPTKLESLCGTIMFDKHLVIGCKRDHNSPFYPTITLFLHCDLAASPIDYAASIYVCLVS